MAVDLFQIYKMYIQRCRRRPWDERQVRNKEDMENLIKNDLTLEEMKEIAEQLRGREIVMGARVNYGARILRALEEGSYKIDVPYQVLHRWRETDRTEGWIYLAVSDDKSGQVKIGATTMPIWKREYSYNYRYGYSIDILWKRRVSMPFTLETDLKEIFRSSLVSGLTDGDSNEWYFGNFEQMSLQVDQYVDDVEG